MDDFQKAHKFPVIPLSIKYRNCQSERIFEKDIEILWQIYYAKYKEFRTNVLAWRWKRRGYIMNDEETRKELHELIDQIKDVETISFIYKIVVRLVD